MNIYEELEYRGLIHDVTSKDLKDKLNQGGLTFYIGTDPTGDSLHIGHFSSLLCAKRLKDHGHHPIMLVGGATGFIGDPKDSGERNMLTQATLKYNYDALSKQIRELFKFEMVNNYDWTHNINILSFLRDYGKHFNVNYMINKDTVKRRLDSGISYTEFSYMILQSLDFLHLYEHNKCTLQLGGQDQWGNITSGLELIRKVHGADVECYGLTMPLITKSDGTKFGKSENGTIWLDKNKTSPYEMYQFLLNTEDNSVISYLKKLTFLTKDEIDILEKSVKEEPFKRLGQKALAKEVVTFLHGSDAYEEALSITNALFGGNILDLNKTQLSIAIKGFEHTMINDSMPLIDLLVIADIASSKREGRDWLNQGSIQLNGVKVSDEQLIIDDQQCIVDHCVLIKRGKRNYYVIQLGVK